MILLSPKMVDRGPLTPQVFSAKGEDRVLRMIPGLTYISEPVIF